MTAHEPQGVARIDGQVIDSDSRPVEGATVWIDTHPMFEVTTDASGGFVFEGLLPRAYRVGARKANAAAGPMTIFATPATTKTDPIILRLRPGSRLDVHVVSKEDGAPISDGEVILSDDYGTRRATTDHSGVAIIEGIGTGVFQLAATAPGRASSWSEIIFSVPTWQKVEIKLSTGSPISGDVLDEKGLPVSGAQIILEATASPFAGHDITESDHSGKWTLPAVGAGTYRVWAIPQASDEQNVLSGSSPPIEHDGINPRSDIRITLLNGSALSGTVVSPDGHPAPYSRVRVTATHGNTFGDSFVQTVYSDGAGAFVVRGFPPQDAHMVADLDDLVSDPIAVPHSRFSQPIRLQLAAGDGIQGTVLSNKNEPVPEIQVFASATSVDKESAPDLLSALKSTEFTDAAGQFHIRGIPNGSYSLRAVAPGGRPNDRWSQPANTVHTGDKNVVLRLQSSGRLVGRVMTRGNAAASAFSVALGMRIPTQYQSATGEFVMENARPGTWSIAIVSPNAKRLIIPNITISADKTTDIGTVSLESGRVVSGTVVNAVGSPVPGATVVLGPEIQADSTSLVSPIAFRTGTKSTVADQAGIFTFDGEGQEALILLADEPNQGRSRPVSIAAGIDDMQTNITLLPTVVLAGTTMRAGMPEAALVQLVPESAPQVLLSSSSGTDGAFRFDHLAPDAYVLTATFGAGGVYDRISVSTDTTNGAAKDAVLSMPTGPHAIQVILEQPDTFGQLLFANFNVTAAVAADLESGLARPGIVYVRGVSSRLAVTIPNVPDGTYTACLESIPGDPQEPATIAQQYAMGGLFPVSCKTVEVRADISLKF